MVDFVSVVVSAINIRVALISGDGKKLKMVYTGPVDNKRLMQQIHGVLDRIDNFGGIGITMPGILDMNRGIMLYAPNLDVKNINVVDPMEKRYGVDVSLLNGEVAAVMAEKLLGAGKNLSNIAHLRFGIGIGCGFILNDRVLLGKEGNAHEVGHCTIDAFGKMRCGCGATGHWEAYCSHYGVPNFAKELLATKYKNVKSKLRSVKNLTVEKVYEMAHSDDVAAKIVEEVGRLNAIGVANIIDGYDPELISIGGKTAMDNQEAVLRPILKHVKSHVINKMPKIIISPLGEQASLYGAVADFLDL
jgi:glucokinase